MTDTITRPIDEREAAGYRERFPIFEHTTYLNSCSLGPLSRQAMAALQQYQEDWSWFGAPAWWQRWLPQLDAARERFARLIGAETREIAIAHSISSALSTIATTFDYRERNRVICADLDFPTISYQWLAKAREGVEVQFARAPDRVAVPLSTYQTLMNDRVAAIATSHVFYATGAIQPVRELADLAHSQGARIVVDGYHAVGVIPVDVKALDVDFYVGGTLKWLLGGPGLTFIYVRDGLIDEVQPRVTGWFAAADQFAFDTLRLDLAPSAQRLQMGTPSVPTAYAGVAGMDIILEAEPERIAPRIQWLTERVITRARADGYGIRSPLDTERRGGIVMLEMAQPQETVTALAARHFTVDYRPGLVRVSPHFYNTAEDIDRLMDALAEVQRELRSA